MRDILEKYGAYETGLFLLNLPTGFGKTYQVLKYILDHHSDDRPVYFITNLKKNLPLEDLKTMFEKEGLSEVFDDQVLFVDATANPVVENITELDNLPNEVSQWKEFKILRDKSRFINNHRQDDKVNRAMTQAVDIIGEKIRKEFEPDFRKRLIAYIDRGAKGGSYASPGEKLNWIEREAVWIKTLYPSVSSLRKKVFFMSVDKFFVKNVTLIEPSYYFHEHKRTEGALVFLDEFDASKERILSAIIQAGLEKRIDLVALFQQIFSAFQTLALPLDLLQESKARQRASEGEEQRKTISEIVTHLSSESTRITERFHLEAPFKTVEPDNKRNFIFHDFQYQTILKEGFRYVNLEYDELNKVNNILFEPKSTEGTGLLQMLANLRGYLQYFAKGVWIVAMNYRSLKEERGARDFPIDNAIRTVLDLFNLNSFQVNYLLDVIANHQTKSRDEGLPRSNYLREHSFYMNGFRYYDFVDSDNHDLASRIYLCSFETTPEKLILKLAQRANVVGISATATSETPVGNYDLTFLKQRLKESYREVDDEEYNELISEFQSLTKGFDQVHIKTRLVKFQASLEDTISVFNDRKFSEELLGLLEKAGGKRDFFIRRYLRLAECFRHFLENDKIKSFLYLGNALPKGYGNQDFGESIIHRMFTKLLENQPTDLWSDRADQHFITIDSGQFDIKKQKLLAALSQGCKVFVISTYQTIGAGQNLQYQVPHDLEVIKIHNRQYGPDMKDIDAIYCERPTNLLVNKFSPKTLSEDQLVENIFQVEFLAESGEIEDDQARHEIRTGFELVSGRTRKISKKDLTDENLYSKESFAHHLSKVIIQAIGRIARTNHKSSEVHILAHDRLNGKLRKSRKARQIYLKEFEALLSVCKTDNFPANAPRVKAFNIAGRNDRKCIRLVNSMLHHEFDENNKKFWQDLRDFVLKNPRIEKPEDIPEELSIFYFELPTGFYGYKCYKHKKKQVYHALKNAEGGVSGSECRLDTLMKVPQLRDFFEISGYATSFGTGAFIMTPTTYQSIYKGMLGETIGRYILERETSLELEALEVHEYELFDFKTPEGIYIDFKHWFVNGFQDGDSEQERFRKKKEKVGADKVMIINLLGPDTFGPSSYEGILQVPCLINESTMRVDTSIVMRIIDFVNG